MPNSLRSLPLSLLLAALCGSAALAQCTNPWLAENSPTGLNGEVYAVHRWDRDGAGPLPELWVFAGEFTGAGTISADRIVTYDPATLTWSALGTGVNGLVHAMATLPNGDLVVAGEFTTAGGIPTNRIAVWNGNTWATLGSGSSVTVYALTVRPSGTLVASGWFTVPGSAAAIAEWNGTTWSAVGSMTSGGVRAFATMANGDLLATGGGLQLTTGGPYHWVVRWNGTSWLPFGTAAVPQPFFSINYDVLVRANGDVVLSGDAVHLLAGGTSRVVIWNGSAWTTTNANDASPPQRLRELTTGELVAGGSVFWNVSRLVGTNWVLMGIGGRVRAMCVLPAGGLLAGGNVAAGPDILRAARWDGTTWLPVGAGGWAGETPRVTVRPDGSLVLAVTRTPTSYLGLRTAGGWTSLGSANGSTLALGTLPNGDVLAGGLFTFLGGVPARRIARWNGTSWSQLGTGVGPSSSTAERVEAIVVAPNGDVIVGGVFTTPANSIARWNGTSWSAFGSGFTGIIKAVALSPNGDVIVGGDLGNGTGPMAHVARWNGTTWVAMGQGLNEPVADLAVLHDGRVAACGWFTLPGPSGPTFPGVAMWSPASGTWTAIGTTTGAAIESLLTAANGDLVVGGGYVNHNGVSLQGIARWNGAVWSGLSTATVWVSDLALAPNGDIAVGGGIVEPGGIHSPTVARLSTTCPATVTSIGMACTGAGGNPTLTATSLPWLGTTFRSRATGLPANSLALEVLSHTSLPAPVPLNAILPQGIAGCTLTTTPELLNLYVPNAGAVDLALPLAPSIAFVGYDIYQQVVALSFGPSFDIVALTSSNSLQLTKGWF